MLQEGEEANLSSLQRQEQSSTLYPHSRHMLTYAGAMLLSQKGLTKKLFTNNYKILIWFLWHFYLSPSLVLYLKVEHILELSLPKLLLPKLPPKAGAQSHRVDNGEWEGSYSLLSPCPLWIVQAEPTVGAPKAPLYRSTCDYFFTKKNIDEFY